MSAWNVSDIDKMVLPPCHVLCQFFVNGDKLSCQMYQRSADMGLGVPYNVASYSLLTYLIAHLTGLKPYMFIHDMADCHVYSNHIDGLTDQIERIPYKYPTITISEKFKDINKIELDHITLNDYKSYPAIKLDMAV